MYLISEIAKKCDLSNDSIRFYEKKGLIQPIFRADNQYRYYDEHCLKRLLLIRRCRSLDMSLKEIQALIEIEQNPSANCAAVNDLIDQHLEEISNKIKELKEFKNQLAQLRQRCHTPTTVDHCEILKHLEAE